MDEILSQCPTKLVLRFDPPEDEGDVNYVTFTFAEVSQFIPHFMRKLHRIAINLRGRKLVDPKEVRISQRKLSWMAFKLRSLQKFSPSIVSCYTVVHKDIAIPTQSPL